MVIARNSPEAVKSSKNLLMRTHQESESPEYELRIMKHISVWSTSLQLEYGRTLLCGKKSFVSLAVPWVSKQIGFDVRFSKTLLIYVGYIWAVLEHWTVQGSVFVWLHCLHGKACSQLCMTSAVCVHVWKTARFVKHNCWCTMPINPKADRPNTCLDLLLFSRSEKFTVFFSIPTWL